jgi:hypothetical protein
LFVELKIIDLAQSSQNKGMQSSLLRSGHEPLRLAALKYKAELGLDHPVVIPI